MSVRSRLVAPLVIGLGACTAAVPSTGGEDAAPSGGSEDTGAISAADTAPARDMGPATDGPAVKDSGRDSARRETIPGMPTCRPGQHLFCEDFESGALDTGALTWGHYGYNGWSGGEETTGKVEVPPFGGAAGSRYALHIHTAKKDCCVAGHVTTKKVFPVAGSRLFIRAFVYLSPDGQQPTAVDQSTYFDAIQAVSTEPAPNGHDPAAGGLDWSYGLDLNGTGPTWRWLVGWKQGADHNGDFTASGSVSGAQWTCWEWELRGTDNELYLSLDDQPVPSATSNARNQKEPWVAPPKVQMRFGLIAGHSELFPAKGYDLWYDQIAVDDKPIGCGN